jgi:hypothetical protein
MATPKKTTTQNNTSAIKGIIILVILAFIAYAILPILVTLAFNVVQLIATLAVLGFIVYMIINPKFRNLVMYTAKNTVKKITSKK